MKLGWDLSMTLYMQFIPQVIYIYRTNTYGIDFILDTVAKVSVLVGWSMVCGTFPVLSEDCDNSPSTW